jgi:hypothetical protein
VLRRCLALVLPASVSVLVACGSGGEEPAPAQTAAPSPKTETVAVSAPLKDVEDGRSTSRVDTALSEYRTGYSINVHSTEGGFPVVACGDIPTG